MYEAKVLADSIASGVRLTTLQVTMPRFILAEFNTHRMLSRNSASSRAIPVEKRIEQVRADPFVPEAFGKNQRGMQAGTELSEADQVLARERWRAAALQACESAERLAASGVHKQWANRLIEPFCWHTVIVTATEWANFFALRCHPAAQPEMQVTAGLMREAMDGSKPVECPDGMWHLPYVDTSMGDFEWARRSTREHGSVGIALAKLSTARCARVSYLTHEGLRDVKADLGLHDRLFENRHMSPFEHAAQVRKEYSPREGGFDGPGTFIGNFRWPWVQYRKMLPGEAVFAG